MALIWLTQLKNRDEYTANHSLNVCILALFFGRSLGLNIQQLNELGIGALLHDIGKLRVPLEILNKPTRLTEVEFEVMKKHAMLGIAMGSSEAAGYLDPRGCISGQLNELVRPLLQRGKENKELAQLYQAIRMEVNQETAALEEFLLTRQAKSEDTRLPGLGGEYHLIITPFFAGQDPMEPVRYVVETGSADALIINQTLPDDPRVRYLVDRGFPFASHGRTEMGVEHPYFDYDNEAFSRIVMGKLAKRGCKSVVMIAPPREQTYSNAL
ncbi:MAG: HD domain-containing protein, partial [Maritimibacter sp.]